MKSKMTFALIIIFGVIITGCKQTEQKVEEVKIDLINDEFPESQAEIREVFDGIWKSIEDKDMDKLISYHAYSSKFTEFQNGAKRAGSKENEAFERSFFPSFTGINKWDVQDLKIDVFGDVALATFHADFQPIIKSDTLKIVAQMGLLFVKTEDGWKITHEHSSPLNEKGELSH